MDGAADRLISLRERLRSVTGYDGERWLAPYQAPSDQDIAAAEAALGIELPKLYTSIIRTLAAGLPPQLSLYLIGTDNEVDIVHRNREIRSAPLDVCVGHSNPVQFHERYIAFGDDFFQRIVAFDLSSSEGSLTSCIPVVQWARWGEIVQTWPSFELFIESEILRLERYLNDWTKALSLPSSATLQDVDRDIHTLASQLPLTQPGMYRLIQGELITVNRYIDAGVLDPLVREFGKGVGFTETFLEHF